MGWSDTWSDIIAGGNPRWKVTSHECHLKALSHFETHVVVKQDADPSTVSVLCPLAGDDPFVHLLFQKGYNVTTIDMVPAAIEKMKDQFGSECSWTKEEQNHDSDGNGSNTTIVWTHESGRATLMVGDALYVRHQLFDTFDAVYDKDSFGALEKKMRQTFCTRMAEYTKKGAIIYLECKLRDNHDQAKDVGPPFSLKKEDLMEDNNYGANFDHVQELGIVYDITMPMQQTGHILKRK
mmetsp:Transcript_10184/g.11278  ORF Transcript_10184/g.11278 Transcript_10184/m.11278 type:complete len:237 (-) Transcript_10184:220-930(-)